jgi:hypothetical protein
MMPSKIRMMKFFILSLLYSAAINTR